jgi:hypothetical protein
MQTNKQKESMKCVDILQSSSEIQQNDLEIFQNEFLNLLKQIDEMYTKLTIIHVSQRLKLILLSLHRSITDGNTAKFAKSRSSLQLIIEHKSVRVLETGMTIGEICTHIISDFWKVDLIDLLNLEPRVENLIAFSSKLEIERLVWKPIGSLQFDDTNVLERHLSHIGISQVTKLSSCLFWPHGPHYDTEIMDVMEFYANPSQRSLRGPLESVLNGSITEVRQSMQKIIRNHLDICSHHVHLDRLFNIANYLKRLHDGMKYWITSDEVGDDGAVGLLEKTFHKIEDIGSLELHATSGLIDQIILGHDDTSHFYIVDSKLSNLKTFLVIYKLYNDKSFLHERFMRICRRLEQIFLSIKSDLECNYQIFKKDKLVHEINQIMHAHRILKTWLI